MSRGGKSSYTDRQMHQAGHTGHGGKKKGHSATSAERIDCATVNRQAGGGKKDSHES